MSYALQAPLPEQAFGHSALAPATRARKTATERIVEQLCGSMRTDVVFFPAALRRPVTSSPVSGGPVGLEIDPLNFETGFLKKKEPVLGDIPRHFRTRPARDEESR